MQSTDEVYAYIATQEGRDGFFGISTKPNPNPNNPHDFIPFIGSKEHAELLRPYATKMAKDNGFTLTLVKYTRTEEVEVINPGRVS